MKTTKQVEKKFAKDLTEWWPSNIFEDVVTRIVRDMSERIEKLL